MEIGLEGVFKFPLFMGILYGFCLALAIIAVIFCLRNQSHIKKLQNAHRNLAKLASGKDLDALLGEEVTKGEYLVKEVAGHNERLMVIENNLRKTIDHVGFVRFNSSETVGADLSYALALLNQEGDGILLTSIYTLEECRNYGKRINKGRCQTQTSHEEKGALEEACQGLRI